MSLKLSGAVKTVILLSVFLLVGLVMPGVSRAAAPVVIANDIETGDGTYGAGQDIYVSVTYDQVVFVSGIAKLSLNTAPAQDAVYESGDGTNTLIFKYTVYPGDSATDLGAVGTGAISVTDMIHDGSSVLADNTLVDDLTGGNAVVIDGVAPVLSAESAGDVTDVTATLNFTSDDAGTYYYLVYLAVDSAPNATTVKAQGVAVASGTDAVVAGANVAGISGLVSLTNYEAYVVVEDSLANLSAVSAVGFITSASPSDLVSVGNIEDLIDSIPDFTDVAGMLAAIGNVKAARDAYDNNLTPEQQSLVGNYSTLTDFEDMIDTLFPDLLAEIYGQLGLIGIDTNIQNCDGLGEGEGIYPDDCQGLYFERTGFGRITFPGSLDLTDFDTIITLGNLQSGISFENGQIQFDAEAGSAFQVLGGVLEMFDLNFASIPNIYVDGDLAGDEDVDNVDYDPATGILTFDALHFSTFSTEESDEDEDEPEEAKVDSWKATIVTDKSSCPEKLKLVLKGHRFDDDAEVKIGDREASYVDSDDDEELTAKFCLAKLMKSYTGSKRTISVKNPDADTAKAKKKIDVGLYAGGAVDIQNFDMDTAEGVKNIQRALVSLGYLDKQYITGVYGPITTEAVKKFQASHGIAQAGNVGPLTSAALKKALK